METVETFIRGENIRLAREGFLTSTPFSFNFPCGLLIAIVGRNGAGKSSLLHGVLGHPVLKEGKIFLRGSQKSTRELSAREIGRLCAFVPQEHSYPAHFRVRDLLRFSAESVNAYAENLLNEALIGAGLKELAERGLGQLSSGQRQRAFLAAALIKKPQILLLDEPTNHLDPAHSFEFWKALNKAKKTCGILVSTHDLSFVRNHADAVFAMGDGNLIYHGSAEKFFGEGHCEKLFGSFLTKR